MQKILPQKFTTKFEKFKTVKGILQNYSPPLPLPFQTNLRIHFNKILRWQQCVSTIFIFHYSIQNTITTSLDANNGFNVIITLILNVEVTNI